MVVVQYCFLTLYGPPAWVVWARPGCVTVLTPNTLRLAAQLCVDSQLCVWPPSARRLLYDIASFTFFFVHRANRVLMRRDNARGPCAGHAFAAVA